jgi:prefoldin alpha subunit
MSATHSVNSFIRTTTLNIYHITVCSALSLSLSISLSLSLSLSISIHSFIMAAPPTQSAQDDEAGMQIDIAGMTMPQLQQLKQQLTQEMELITSNLGSLKIADGKFGNSEEAVRDIAEQDGAEMLVPLTSALYVPGKLKNTNKLLVDIGTGFFVQRDVEQTVALMGRKRQMIQNSIATVEKVLERKRESMESLTVAIQQRAQLDQIAQQRMKQSAAQQFAAQAK